MSDNMLLFKTFEIMKNNFGKNLKFKWNPTQFRILKKIVQFGSQRSSNFIIKTVFLYHNLLLL